MIFEIVIPVRNPTQVFDKTIDSLIHQSTRDFCVFISNNHSSKGMEFLESALLRLRAAEISVRVQTPPCELDRVSNWNWAHSQTEATWIKPLFMGDYLEPDYFSKVSEIIAMGHTGLIVCCGSYHRNGRITPHNCNGHSGVTSADIVIREAIINGNFLGGPFNVVYPSHVYRAVGGYSSMLPFLADFDCYVRMAIAGPVYIVPLPLANFVIHSNRFTTRGAQMQRSNIQFEQLLVYWSLVYLAYCRRVHLPIWPAFRMFCHRFVSCTVVCLWWVWHHSPVRSFYRWLTRKSP
jgi:hypothetical protein